ncbi:hypothetical protein BDZ97DRAFT_1826398 [Flammula alnicola]|nr:hypothetical protein BDZ97DRAFT_1826398 [Flammula alnicola]
MKNLLTSYPAFHVVMRVRAKWVLIGPHPEVLLMLCLSIPQIYKPHGTGISWVQ